MINEKVTEINDITPIFESDLLSIDETKLPVILSERLNLLEKTNKAYDSAKAKEKDIRKKVDKAMNRASELIVKAKGAGTVQSTS